MMNANRNFSLADIDVSNKHICILVARYYEDIADALLKGATSIIESMGATYEIIEVPGAFEIPAVVRMAIYSGRYDGYVALGCVIRGETTHYDYICAESAHGLNQLAIDYAEAIGYGIITVENKEQAWARATPDKENRGKDAAVACLKMISVKDYMKPTATTTS